MAFRLKKKEIRLEEGYVTIRQISPMDNIMLSRVLKDKEDNALVENAIIAMSLVEIVEPNYDEPNYMILDPDKIKYNPEFKDRYILNPEFVQYNPEFKERYISKNDGTDEYELDPNNPDNYILDPNNSANFILDRAKSITRKFKPTIEKEEEIFSRIQFSYSDWQIVAYHSIKMNEPNPELLGE